MAWPRRPRARLGGRDRGAALLVALAFVGAGAFGSSLAAEEAGGGGRVDAMRRGKIAVGEGAVSQDPRVRREAFARALPEFRAVLDEGPSAPPERLAQARTWIRQLRAEQEPNRLLERALEIRVLVVLCPLEGVVRRFNAEKYRALAYKVRDREDPEIARQVRERSYERVRIGTSFGVEDRNHLKGWLDRAVSLVFDWSRGDLALDFRVESISGRVSDLRERRGSGRGLWLLGDPPRGEDGPANADPAQVLEKIERLSPGDADVVLLVPKYERGGEALPRPSANAERRARFAPWDGRTPIAHLAFESRPDGKATDGAALERTFALDVVDRVYEALRQSAVRYRTGGDPQRALESEAVEGAAPWWPPSDETLRIGYRELPVGEELYAEVFGSWISPGMVGDALALPRAFRSAKRVRVDRAAAACVDGDVSSGRRATTESPIVTGPEGLPANVRIRLEPDGDGADGPGEERVLAPAAPGRGGVPIRFALAGPLKIRRVSIEVLEGEEDDETALPRSVDVREVMFFDEP